MDALAQELVDRIIDGCSESDTAIRACSLVCKRWLYRSRYHLFFAVTLTRSNLRSFAEIVDASALPIPFFICSLRLRCDDSALDTNDLARIHPCPNLASIEVSLEHMHNCVLNSVETHLRIWNDESVALSCLELTARFLPVPMHTISTIVSCVPNSKTLRMYGFAISTPPGDTTSTRASGSFCPLRLKHLFLRVHNPGFLFAWLGSLPVIPLLASLEFGIFRVQHDFNAPGAPIVAYFQHAGEALETLAVSTRADTTLFLARILPHTPNLKNLVFYIYQPSHVLDIVDSLPAISALTAIRAQSSVPCYGSRDILWGVLDAVLAQPRFSALRRFSLQKPGDVMAPEIKLLMPLASARGILD